MYTGTLIQDLISAVERVERRAQQRHFAGESELRRMFGLEIPKAEIASLQIYSMRVEPAYAGAA